MTRNIVSFNGIPFLLTRKCFVRMVKIHEYGIIYAAFYLRCVGLAVELTVVILRMWPGLAVVSRVFLLTR